MKKILYISRDLTHMYFHLSYLKHLINEGNKVYIACNINKATKDFEQYGIKCIHIDFARKTISNKHIKAYRQIKDLCIQENFNIVHLHTPIASFIGRYAIKNLKCKVIYTAHGLHFFKGAPVLNWLIYYPLEKIAAKWTDAMILINNEDFILVKENFKLRNDKVYYVNGVGIECDKFIQISNDEKNEYINELKIDKTKLTVCCVAELNKNKNQMFLLKSINKCKNKDRITAIFVGEGNELDNLKNYTHENDIDARFLGYRRDVPKILSVCDALALISKREGLPKSIMEGMASSLVILGTNTRGIRDMIDNGENGFVVDLNDENKLAEYIDRLSVDNKLVSKLKRNSLTKSYQYEEKNIINQLDKIYSEIVSLE